MVEVRQFWTTEDGMEFESKADAMLHEQELKSPTYKLQREIDELKKRIEHLEAENLKRLAEIESLKNPFKTDSGKPDSYWPPRVYYRCYNPSILDAVNDFFETDKKDEEK